MYKRSFPIVLSTNTKMHIVHSERRSTLDNNVHAARRLRIHFEDLERVNDHSSLKFVYNPDKPNFNLYSPITTNVNSRKPSLANNTMERTTPPNSARAAKTSSSSASTNVSFRSALTQIRKLDREQPYFPKSLVTSAQKSAALIKETEQSLQGSIASLKLKKHRAQEQRVALKQLNKLLIAKLDSIVRAANKRQGKA